MTYNPDNLNPAQLWMLALGAPLFESNKDGHDTIYGGVQDIEKAKHLLERDWGITTKQELMQQLDVLALGQHEIAAQSNLVSTLSVASQKKYFSALDVKSREYTNLSLAKTYYYSLGSGQLQAWEYVRYVFLCRFGVIINLLTAQEAWELMRKIAVKAQKAYPGWREYGIAYFAGRQYWRGIITREFADAQVAITKRLITDEYSPWNMLDWQLNLEE